MDASQTHYAVWRKLDTKEYILYGFHLYEALESGNLYTDQ